MTLEVDAIDANGQLVAAIATGQWDICATANACYTGPQPVGGIYSVNIPPALVPAVPRHRGGA